MNFSKIKSLIRLAFSYFFKGVFLLAPFYLTFLVVAAALHKIDNIVISKIPGLGLLVLFFGSSLIGYFGTHFLLDRVIGSVEKFLGKLPLINLLYASSKDVLKALVGEKRKFDKPVLVTISKYDHLYKVGFITKDDLSQIGLPGKASVYILKPYSLLGDLFFIDRDALIPLDASASEVSKLIISGGFTD